MPDAPWFVYIARCADGTLYTGVARDVRARIAQHDRGRGARYTRGRGPLALCAVRRCGSMGAALSLEAAVKRLRRSDKESLANPRSFRAFATATQRRRGTSRRVYRPAASGTSTSAQQRKPVE